MANYGPVVAPPGGIYRYNRNGENLSAFTRQSLITQLIDYRRANAKKIGDPERDVDQELAKRYGGHHSPLSAGEIAEPPTRVLTLTERVGAWLSTRYAKLGSIKYVSTTDATQRASICLKCPLNQEWRTSCRSCSDQIPRIEENIVIISQNRQVPQQERLYACAAAGHENRVAVWLTTKHLQHAKHYDRSKFPEMPKMCWLRKLLK